MFCYLHNSLIKFVFGFYINFCVRIPRYTIEEWEVFCDVQVCQECQTEQTDGGHNFHKGWEIAAAQGCNMRRHTGEHYIQTGQHQTTHTGQTKYQQTTLCFTKWNQMNNNRQYTQQNHF